MMNVARILQNIPEWRLELHGQFAEQFVNALMFKKSEGI
jgi:hypothetical protein